MVCPSHVGPPTAPRRRLRDVPEAGPACAPATAHSLDVIPVGFVVQKRVLEKKRGRAPRPEGKARQPGAFLWRGLSTGAAKESRRLFVKCLLRIERGGLRSRGSGVATVRPKAPASPPRAEARVREATRRHHPVPSAEMLSTGRWAMGVKNESTVRGKPVAARLSSPEAALGRSGDLSLTCPQALGRPGIRVPQALGRCPGERRGRRLPE